MKKNISKSPARRAILLGSALVIAVAGLSVAGFFYVDSVNETIYTESTAHLTEIYRQSTDSLNKIVKRNWSAMHVWSFYLEDHSDPTEVSAFLESAKSAINFTGFYFFDERCDYRSIDGKEGRLEIPNDTLFSLMLDQQDVITNIPVVGEEQSMFFAIPSTGTFDGFDYSAIGVYFNSEDLLSTIQVNAFDGEASSYVIHEDGRIVMEKSNGKLPITYNLFSTLRDSSLSETDIEHLKETIKTEPSGDTSFRYQGKSYYLVFQDLSFEEWVVVGIVPTHAVNSAMNQLQTTTIAFVTAVMAFLILVTLGIVAVRLRRSLQKTR